MRLRATDLVITTKMPNFAVEKRGQIWLLATTQKNAKIAGTHSRPAVLTGTRSTSKWLIVSNAMPVNDFSRQAWHFFVRRIFDNIHLKT